MSQTLSNDQIIDTYKSVWYQDSIGNYKREQKQRYPYERIAELLNKTPIINKLAHFSLIGRKPQGVDYYRTYTKFILERKGWENEFPPIDDRFNQLGTSLDGKNILDISGEPGFFAEALMKKYPSSHILVTAFADDVAETMQDHLQNVDAVKFDYNTDHIATICKDQKFDVIFVRYSIGFCLDIASFFDQCYALLKDGGILYVSYSPASRGVCARWMFDDYTYLRQYTHSYMKDVLAKARFTFMTEWDEGDYQWDYQLRPVQKILSKRYIKAIFTDCDTLERNQHNLSLMLKK